MFVSQRTNAQLDYIIFSLNVFMLLLLPLIVYLLHIRQASEGIRTMRSQSGLESTATMQQTSGGLYQNVRFQDQNSQHVLDIRGEMDVSRAGQDSNDAELGDFFSRPIKISSTEWSTSTFLFTNFNPWKLYFENPRVANRLTNFHLLRCKLHVKFIINGNGFQYGRALASYLPLAQLDKLSVNSGLIPQSLIQASQQPHLFLDPTLSQGGEMVLPFFYYKNNMSIPDSDWNEMGEITVRSINDLKHANGADDVVTVSVFAWAEDVKLGVLTSRESTSLTPQSGKEIEEANAKGFISGPATSVGAAAAKLADAPIIGPYATATAMIANGMGSMAKLLGYSRPPQTQNPTLFTNTAVSSMALTTVPDSVDKLTIDDKCELSIDTRIAGLDGTDPMSIVGIASRESYWTKFTWPIGAAPETLLWNCRVSPVVWDDDGLTPRGYYLPACCMAAYPFRYWTGTMKYRFQIVCSSFHKGRIKVVYDPNWLASNEYNTNYMEIVDIADKTDFTIEVKNGQEFTLLDHHHIGIDSKTQLFSTTGYTSKEEGNGVIGFYVVNELTTPNSTVNNDVEVNVFVSTGDDFQVFVPEDEWQEFVFKPQSGMEVPESENTEEKNKPEHTITTELGIRYDPMEHLSCVFTGESIKSFRPLLKRYNLHCAYAPNDSAYSVLYVRVPQFPYLRGAVPGAVNNTAGSTAYNYCNTVLLHWVTLAHQGWRGSTRSKWLVSGRTDGNAPSYMTTNRVSEPGFNLNVFALPTMGTQKQAAFSAMYNTPGTLNHARQYPFGHTGMTFRAERVNLNAQTEMPFYSRDRFNPGKVADWTSQSVADRRDIESQEMRLTIDGDANQTGVYHYVAAGEDFQVYFFTGLPVMYWENAPPA